MALASSPFLSYVQCCLPPLHSHKNGTGAHGRCGRGAVSAAAPWAASHHTRCASCTRDQTPTRPGSVTASLSSVGRRRAWVTKVSFAYLVAPCATRARGRDKTTEINVQISETT